MKIVVVGGGVSGMMTAGMAKHFTPNNEVIILEKNEKLGKKLYITGKGRCNLTNQIDNNEFLTFVVNNSKFLYSSINKFSPYDTIDFFKENGLDTKVERGGRVFPITDKASDVTKALEKFLRDNNVKIMLNQTVKSVSKEANQFTIITATDKITCDKVVLALGGKSYPLTGSDGYGYILAHNFGHNIIEPKSALAPIILSDDVSALQGVSLKNVGVSCIIDNKVVCSLMGEMLFTDKSITGPIILSMSSYINRLNLKNAYVSIDMKPALSEEVLDKRILRDFEKMTNKQLKNSLVELLPKALIDIVIERSAIPPYKAVNVITKEERTALVKVIKGIKYKIDRIDDIAKGIITSGGVDTKEINPKTMESKLVSGLYFAGEMIDVDALTGGYNIQIALSTATLAGENVGKTNIKE